MRPLPSAKPGGMGAAAMREIPRPRTACGREGDDDGKDGEERFMGTPSGGWHALAMPIENGTSRGASGTVSVNTLPQRTRLALIEVNGCLLAVHLPLQGDGAGRVAHFAPPMR